MRASTYGAVHQGDRVLLLRDQHPLPKKHAEDLTPQGRDLEILRALWRYRFLLTSQIADEVAPVLALRGAAAALADDGGGLGDALSPPPLEGKARVWRPRHVTEYSAIAEVR
jgi:hypothetical protein